MPALAYSARLHFDSAAANHASLFAKSVLLRFSPTSPITPLYTCLIYVFIGRCDLSLVSARSMGRTTYKDFLSKAEVEGKGKMGVEMY